MEEAMIWTTSDTHIAHKNIIQYDKRPYQSVEEMDNHIIDTLNKYVATDDLFVFGGDFALPRIADRDDMVAYNQAISDYHARINCKNWIFVGGNHDRLYHRRRGNYVPNWKFWETFRSENICMKCDALFSKEKLKCPVCGSREYDHYDCIHPMGYEMRLTRKLCSEHSIPPEFDGFRVVFSHYSHRVFNKSHIPGKSCNLYGHSHHGLPGMRSAIDVGWNGWYRPLSLVEILTEILPKHNEKFGELSFPHHAE